MSEHHSRRREPDLDLFEEGRREQIAREQPLAARLRPDSLDQFVGQEHILGPGRLLRRAIQADQLSSLIFYGPPGTGKTTLAHVIANTTKSYFISINAVLAGVGDIRKSIEEAKERRHLHNQRTILFVDEVHRFNKAQQDALLPWVENGTVILIGATTENPYFAVNRPLVSRSRLFQLKTLTEHDLTIVVRNALNDPRGYKKIAGLKVDDDAINHLVDVANGDARALLNALELAVETTQSVDNEIHIDLKVAEESIQRRAVLYDKEGDYHFDTISAFIKSMRGSDPDATMYWLARMVYAGEDPRFIFRRMVIFASEDIGLADPSALQVVIAAAAAFDRVGLPEGRFPLAHAALHMATAPKSNSSFAFFDALTAVEKEKEDEVPNHLKDANRDSEGFGHGDGYLYPHAYRDHWVAQQYLPQNLQGRVFYQPSKQGQEGSIRIEVERRREMQLASVIDEDCMDPVPGENLTHSQNELSDQWLERAAGETSNRMGYVRDSIFRSMKLERHHRVIDLAAGSGLLTWEALRRTPEGAVWAVCTDPTSATSLRQRGQNNFEEIERPQVIETEMCHLRNTIESIDTQIRFDAIIGRNALGNSDVKENIIQQLRVISAPGSQLRLWELMQERSQRLCDLVDLSELDNNLRIRVISTEEEIYNDVENPRVNWNHETFTEFLTQNDFGDIICETESLTKVLNVGMKQLTRWFDKNKTEDRTFSWHLHQRLTEAEVQKVRNLFERQLCNKEIPWKATYAFFKATAQ